MRRLLVIVLSVLAALLGSAVSSAASPPFPTDLKFTHLYTYNGHSQAAASTHSTTDRGPPSMYDGVTAYNAGDCWSRGGSSRSDTTTPALAPVTYGDPVPLVQVVGVETTSPLAAEGTRGGKRVAPPGRCCRKVGTQSETGPQAQRRPGPE